MTLAISDPDREDEGIDECGSEWWREARVFQFVREKNENVIAFAIYVAGSPSQIRSVDCWGVPLLHSLIRYRLSHRIIRMLVGSNRGKMYAIDVKGNTPFHMAAMAESENVLRVFTSPHTFNRGHHPFFESVTSELPRPLPGSCELNHKGLAPIHIVASIEDEASFHCCLTMMFKASEGTELYFRVQKRSRCPERRRRLHCSTYAGRAQPSPDLL